MCRNMGIAVIDKLLLHLLGSLIMFEFDLLLKLWDLQEDIYACYISGENNNKE